MHEQTDWQVQVRSGSHEHTITVSHEQARTVWQVQRLTVSQRQREPPESTVLQVHTVSQRQTISTSSRCCVSFSSM
ncbi:MAG: hypothetical protein FJ271_07665 [Planctomycetes bacterium]|nr:hypothetical protein [Planctomycetota bacterium]